MMSDVLTLQQAIKWRFSLKNKTVAITNGCFDLIHCGHVSYLMDAVNLADELIVLVNSDKSVKMIKGTNRPIINENERAYIVSCIKPVSKVVIFDGVDCSKELELLSPNVYFKAGDYNMDNLNKKEYDALVKCGCTITFIPITTHTSTTKIIEQITKLNKSPV